MRTEKIREFIGMEGSMAEGDCQCRICTDRREAVKELNQLESKVKDLEKYAEIGMALELFYDEYRNKCKYVVVVSINEELQEEKCFDNIEELLGWYGENK